MPSHTASSGSARSSRRSPMTEVDPTAISRARDLLERADLLVDNAVGITDDDAERFRQLYLAALRGAGAALALHEPRTPRAGRRNPGDAWSRIGARVPDLVGHAEYFAAHSRRRMDIESGLDRTLPAGLLAEFHSRLLTFLDAVEALVIASERGDRGPGSFTMAHPA
ncbi:SAV_6107 family HEPN domain-containing protein [Gordonia sp. NPDC003376]